MHESIIREEASAADNEAVGIKSDLQTDKKTNSVRMWHNCEDFGAYGTPFSVTFKKRSPDEKPSSSLIENSASNCLREKSLDRFIPCRLQNELHRVIRGDISTDQEIEEDDLALNSKQNSRRDLFRRMLRNQFFDFENSPRLSGSKKRLARRLLHFDSTPKQKKSTKIEVLKHKQSSESDLITPSHASNDYDFFPYRSVSANHLQDEFYVNILDWSSKNTIGVSLGSNVYLWNPETNEQTFIPKSTTSSLGSVSNLKFDPTGESIFLGGDNGSCRLLHVEKKLELLKLTGNDTRVGVSCWVNESLLVCGSQDGLVSLFDIRSKNKPQRVFFGFHQEICGLSYSSSVNRLVSGCNNGLMSVWDLGRSEPEKQMRHHKSAVRGVAWSSFERGVIYSGGGKKDKTLKVFNYLNGSLVKTVHVDSQITGITFSKLTGEFVTTHGFMENNICLWNPCDLTAPVATFDGHLNRVIYSAISPSGSDIVTGSGDESLKFWHVFKKRKNSKNSALHPDFRELR